MPAERPGPILVTGANSGIGLASVLRFASRGWQTWGTVRSKAKAAELRAAAKEAGVSPLVHTLVLDVSDDEAVVAAFPGLPAFWGVVNNAGYSEVGAVEEVSAASARAQLDVNLIAPAVVSSCALPGMRSLGGGRIVMVSSIAGRAAVLPLNAWYHASKFGLEALSDVLRMEVAGFGVRVSIVEPGFFKTGIEPRAKEQTEGLAGNDDSVYKDAYRRSAQALEAIGRFAPPPGIVARTIVSAVESRRPLKRYLVGVDALALAAANPLIPKTLSDAATRLFSGLGGSPATYL